MTALLISVFSASAAFGLAAQISHSRSRGKTLSFVLGAMLLYVIISSVPRDIPFEFDISAVLPDGDLDGEYYYAARDALEEALATAVADEFRLSEDDVSVGLIDFDFENMRCDIVVVTLCGMATTADQKGIEKYVNDIGIGRCRVDVELG